MWKSRLHPSLCTALCSSCQDKTVFLGSKRQGLGRNRHGEPGDKLHCFSNFCRVVAAWY